MDTLEPSSILRLPSAILDDLTTVLPDMTTLKTLYAQRPITMHRTYPAQEPMNWPKVIRVAYAQIWETTPTGQHIHPRIIIKAPRGGGKSKLLGTVGFDLWYLKSQKVVNMGGSAVQATIVYNYFKGYTDIHESIASQHIKGVAKAIETRANDGAYFSSVTASTKQTRGKHPDVLISDETCETSDELVHSALPMVDSSQSPLVIMASTFHKIFGIFQETWDSAEERGYLRIQWDIFDVCKPFSKDYWEQENIKKISGIEKLKAYAKGRTGDPDGWVPIENVIQAWREKPTEDWFEVEYLGSRPSAAGLVLKPEDVEKAVFDDNADKSYNYKKGATCILGIDWGFSSMTSVVELMACKDSVVALIDNKNFQQTPSDDIIKWVVQKVKDNNIRFIYADSAGKFENVALQNALAKERIACAVIEVVFSKEKFGTPGVDGAIGMLGNLRAHFEQGKIKIAKRFRDAYWQYKRYRYQEGTDKPEKKMDHIPDATMCALQHFMLGQYARAIPSEEPDQKKKQTTPEPEKQQNDKPITVGLLKKVF